MLVVRLGDMDRSGASSRLSVSRRPVSAGAWTGVSSTSAGSAARHVSATSYRKPYVLDASARPTDELSATKVIFSHCSSLLHVRLILNTQ